VSDERSLVSAASVSARVSTEDSVPPEVGRWYWVKSDEGLWLACIVHVGTNYVNMQDINGGKQRIHMDGFEATCTREENPDRVIQHNIETHKTKVAELLGEIQQVTVQLGIVPRSALAEGTEQAATQALAVVHGTADVQAHKHALIKAKEKTLPDLFKQVEQEHKQVALWMQAQLLPMKAQLEGLKTVTETLESRIFTVELYAGLTEELTQIADGEPALIDAKVHLFQRRHYMDEECLARYEAGGMEFKDIKAFDHWLLRKQNRDRILPLPRCIAAFRVRRHEKERGTPSTLVDFIQFTNENELNEATFLYVRNGDRIYRLQTAIDFGEQLFPDRTQSALLGDGQLWLEISMSLRKVLSQREYDVIMEDRERVHQKYLEELHAWKNGKKDIAPWKPSTFERYELCTPESLFYDDAMKQIARAAMEHNRVAVVLQGLLDRSPALHPHPPWRLFTAEGFAAGIELLYDDSKALTSGAAPDFEAYRTRLNASLKTGCYTVGQQDAWEHAEAAKENARLDHDWRARDHHYRHTRYTPYGNPGPGLVAKVAHASRDGRCAFEWGRERRTTKWVSNPDKPGWMKPDDASLNTRFSCASSALLNVSAYRPGDFRLFYDDPRTRQDYMEWAPLLLAAEDFIAERKP
jgi:hypothetical protein